MFKGPTRAAAWFSIRPLTIPAARCLGAGPPLLSIIADLSLDGQNSRRPSHVLPATISELAATSARPFIDLSQTASFSHLQVGLSITI